ncbi:hypothetical protein B0A49_11413 [Cryomyces minteri]|uniref:Uncharacterized protein n=1 Tax=Cryomyces minteri TaxID=331657 RepID=A0A4U0WGU5_9PEZI|nr:hypothetical protein B0A49_11413 [Cryomyces minteri]
MPPSDVSQHMTPVTPRLDGFPPRVDSRPDNAPTSRADLFQGRNGIGPGNSDFEPQGNRSDSRDGRRREDGPGDDRGFRSDEHRERRSERNGDGSDRGGRHSGRDRERREGGSGSRQGGGMDDGPRAGPPPSTHNSFSHAHANRDPSDSRQQGRNNGAGADEARPGQTGYSGPSQGLGRKNQGGYYQGSRVAEGLGYRGNGGGGNGRFDPRNGDALLRPDGGHGGQRRDDRDDDGRDRRVDGRDGRKRRADEGSIHGDSKRLRRSGP